MKLTKTWFMLKKLGSDLLRPRLFYKISEDFFSERLTYYYFVFEEDFRKLNKLLKQFDENGIPLNSTYIDVKTPRLHYYPISIGQFGLAVFHSFIKTGQKEKREHFLRIANWFMENAVTDERLGTYWLTDIPKPEYGVEHPWKSAFAQSRALSILLRAWQITDDRRYLELATAALKPFSYDITEGGVTAHLKLGQPFYEEYVAAEPTMVLDGHIFSLFGLFDYVRAGINPDAKATAMKLFQDGVDSLIRWLPDYDMGFWVRFNLCRMENYPATDPCTISYLRLIVAQLRILSQMTNRGELLSFAERFESYDRLLNIFRMYAVKNKALKRLNRL